MAVKKTESKKTAGTEKEKPASTAKSSGKKTATAKKPKNEPAIGVKPVHPPSKTPEGRENQLISLAVDLAEKQLREGTASAQVISHYLKLGSPKERLEREILQEQKKLMAAKTEALQSAKSAEEMFTKAVAAMRIYGGDIDEADRERAEDFLKEN